MVGGHLTGGETEAQRDEVTCPGSNSQCWAELQNCTCQSDSKAHVCRTSSLLAFVYSLALSASSMPALLCQPLLFPPHPSPLTQPPLTKGKDSPSREILEEAKKLVLKTDRSQVTSVRVKLETCWSQPALSKRTFCFQWKCSLSALSNGVATSHTWLSST